MNKVYDYASAKMDVSNNQYSHHGDVVTHILKYSFFTTPGSNINMYSSIRENDSTYLAPNESTTIFSTENIKGYNIPITSDNTIWGKILHHNGNVITIKKPKSTLRFVVHTSDDRNVVKIMKNNVLILLFKVIFGANNTSFTREAQNKTFIYKNGNKVFYMAKKFYQFINNLVPKTRINNKFINLNILFFRNFYKNKRVKLAIIKIIYFII